MSFPSKDVRHKCWQSRDSYWQCLDTNAPTHQATSGAPEPQQCIKLRKLFEKDCPSQWVKHFDRRRTYEQFKKKMEQGFDPLEAQSK